MKIELCFFILCMIKKNEVIGFAEYAYLPQTQVLVLDYLCTSQRNHVLFYNFYHMVLNEITDEYVSVKLQTYPWKILFLPNVQF